MISWALMPTCYSRQFDGVDKTHESWHDKGQCFIDREWLVGRPRERYIRLATVRNSK